MYFIYIHSFSYSLPLWFYPRILSIVPCAVSKILLFIHPVYNMFASDNPRLPTYPLLPRPPGNHRSVPCVCEPVLFFREVPLCHILDSKALLNVIGHDADHVFIAGARVLSLCFVICLVFPLGIQENSAQNGDCHSHPSDGTEEPRFPPGSFCI